MISLGNGREIRDEDIICEDCQREALPYFTVPIHTVAKCPRTAVYRVTGTWGSGSDHVAVGDLVERRYTQDRVTVCVGDSRDRSAITGTYFLEVVRP